MRPEDIAAAESHWIVQTYRRPSPVFVRGEGSHLFDDQGKRYLDLASGIAVVALGHSDAEWADAVADQARTLTHVSNLFHTQEHVRLAERLTSNSFADRVFFCNSGTEANEAALKFARRWARANHGEAKTEIVAFEGGFHGRTIGALSITARQHYQAPFAPLMPDVKIAPFNDLEASSEIINARTCGVFIEPLQGEAGVRPADEPFLQGLREICDRNNALLVFDEVQCGLGRTGRLWAHEAYGVTPDMMTLAKPLAGGLPIGAALVSEAVARTIQVGDHGSTFAAGPLVCRAAQIVFDRVCQPEFLAGVREKGDQLMARLRELAAPAGAEVRGRGLLVGVEFSGSVKPLIDGALERGLIVINAGDNVLRLAPPLTITTGEIDEAVAILAECMVREGLA